MKKFWALFVARTKEFYRDRGSMIWTFAFPFLIVLGFSFAFSGSSQDQYKVAVFDPTPSEASKNLPVLKLKYVQYVPIQDLEPAIEKVSRHQYDLMIAPPDRYWVNSSSPKGYFLEKLLPPGFRKQEVTGRETRYVDWLIPGILSMNMMFSALYGVGYTIVRYRKNGVLKRFKATPINAFQFLASQVVSRMLIIQAVGIMVYFGCAQIVDFQMRGSYLDLFLFMSLGGFALVSLSTLIAARISNEELAEGLLNVLSWPMIFFSGVWFSLEGTNPVLQKVAKVFPLSHVVDGARSIMIDGATLASLMGHVTFLGVMIVVFMALGSMLFRWN